MDPLTAFSIIAGNQLSQKIDSWGSTSNKPRKSVIRKRKKKYEKGQSINLSKGESALINAIVCKSYNDKNEFEEISLEKHYPKRHGYYTNDFSNYVEDNNLGPYCIIDDLIIAFGKPYDKSTGMRAYKYKCPSCKTKCVHINRMSYALVDSSFFDEMEGDNFYIDKTCVTGYRAKKLSKKIEEFSFIDNKMMGKYEDGGLMCSNCGDLNWVDFGACDCKDSIKFDDDYRKVAPRAADSGSDTAYICMLCGKNHSLSSSMGRAVGALFSE